MKKLSQIDGELFAVKANIKVTSFPFHAGIEEFKNNTSLEDDPIIKMIKKNKDLKNLAIIKQSRLSVMPIDTKSWKIILNMGRIK